MRKCEKITYRSKKAAWKSSLHFFQKLGTFTGAYKCHHCNKYHLSRLIKKAPEYFWEEMEEWMGVKI